MENMDLEEMLKHIEKLKLAYPKKRVLAANELKPILRSLTELERQTEAFESFWFLTSDRVITDLGKVGREVDMMFVLSLFEQLKAHLNRILESLEYEVR